MVTKNSSDNGESTNDFVSPDDGLRVNLGDILFVLVDDVKRAEVNLKKTNTVNFDLTVDDKEIKVYADDKFGKMFIERFPLNFKDLGAESQSETFKLKGGQKVTFNFNPVFDKDNQVVKIACKLIYAANEKAGIFTAMSLTGSGTAQSKSKVLPWGLVGAFALLLLVFGVGWFMFGNSSEIKPDITKNQVAATQGDNNKPVETAAKETNDKPVTTPTTNDNTNSNSQTAADNLSANNASNSNSTNAGEINFASNAKKPVRRADFETAKSSTAASKANNTKSNLVASANTTRDRNLKQTNNIKSAAQPKTSIIAANKIKTKKVFNNWINRDVSGFNNADETTAIDQSTQSAGGEVTAANDKSTVTNDKDTDVNNKVIAANTMTNNEVQNASGKSLLEIKQIYLDWQGDLELGTKINGQVIEEVQKSGLLSVSDKMVADAALKIYVSRDTDATTKETADKPRIKASMWLVNNAGVIVTPNTKGTSDWKYVGELEKLPVQIVKDVKMLTDTDKKP